MNDTNKRGLSPIFVPDFPILSAATVHEYGRGDARQAQGTEAALDHGDGGVLFSQVTA